MSGHGRHHLKGGGDEAAVIVVVRLLAGTSTELLGTVSGSVMEVLGCMALVMTTPGA